MVAGEKAALPPEETLEILDLTTELKETNS